MTKQHGNHHPHHRFDPAKAQRLLDPEWRLIEDPVQLVKEIGVQKDLHVVDLGSGAGFFTKALLETVGPNGRVAAVELQKPILDFFHKHLGQQPNLEVIQADLCQTGLENSQWDIAFIAFTLHEVQVSKALQEVSRILKPGGLLMVLEWGESEPCPERDKGRRVGPPHDHRLLSGSLIQYLEEAGFGIMSRNERLEGCQYWVVARYR